LVRMCIHSPLIDVDIVECKAHLALNINHWEADHFSSLK